MSATVRLSQLYSILIEKRGKDEADAIVNYVEEKVADDIDHNTQTIYDKIDKSDTQLNAKIDKLNTEFNAKIDKLSAEIKEYVERSLRQQLWAIIALFVPLYLALLGFFWAIFNVVKK